jgi:hypothetical protein
MTRISEARLTASGVEATRRALRQQIVETEQTMAEWHVESSAVFTTFPVPHLITYEPSFCRVQITANESPSADPGEYDGKVTTTPEALAYACGLGGQSVANMGDLGWYSGNQALVKPASYILDRRKLDFTRFRISMDDPESWDFRYPKVEGEISGLYDL